MSKPSFFVQACLGGLLAASIFPCAAAAANPDQAQLEAMQRLNDSGDYAALRDLLETKWRNPPGFCNYKSKRKNKRH